MSASLLLRSSLILGIVAFLALLTHAAVHSVDYAEEAAYSRDLRSIQSVTSELNERVLKSRAALMTQYDPLVEGLRSLQDLHVRLKQVPDFLGSSAAGDMRSLLHESEADLRRKEELIEEFKTHNSVLQNSLHYFPVLANSMIDRARSQPNGGFVAARVQSLIGAVMLFDTSVDAESTARVLGAQLDLSRENSDATGLKLGREVELLLSHSRIILDRKPVVDGLVQQILAIPLTVVARQLEEAYSVHYRTATDRALLQRQLLFALALATVVLGLTDVILRIRRSAAALELATTELRSANGALAREREKERQLSELKTRFVSMTSHEFRTPLSVIVSSTDLLKSYSERWGTERRMDHLDRIRSAAGSMWRMLDDILTIGRAEAGVLHASPTQLNLDDFCRSLVESLEPSSAGSHCIRYRFNGDPHVTHDERLLSEVLGNLLGNALKYSPAGGEVSFEVCSSDQSCHFTVRDQGIGIPAAELPRLFETFFRGSNAAQIRGSGLGLAVVKKALQVQEGTIEVESQLGRGSIFSVRIPRNLPMNRASSSEL